MTDTIDALVFDLLEWVGPEGRSYAETIDAWRTSCPRLPVWEDATDRGFISRYREPGQTAMVIVSPTGLEHLRTYRPVRR